MKEKKTQRRIVVKREYKFGNLISTNFVVEEYSRNYSIFWIIPGLLVPIIGWALLLESFFSGDFQLKWRELDSFDSLKKAEYLLDHDKIFNTTNELH